MSEVISSFRYNGEEGKESLTQATINNIGLIKESIPMSYDHFLLVKNAIIKAHNIGVDKTTKHTLEKMKDYNKLYL
jgi:hypothetical protein